MDVKPSWCGKPGCKCGEPSHVLSKISKDATESDPYHLGFSPPDTNGLSKCLTCNGRGGRKPGNRTCNACAGQGYVRKA